MAGTWTKIGAAAVLATAFAGCTAGANAPQKASFAGGAAATDAVGYAKGYATFGGKRCVGTIEISMHRRSGGARAWPQIKLKVPRKGPAKIARLARLTPGTYDVVAVRCAPGWSSEVPPIKYRGSMGTVTARMGETISIGTIDVKMKRPLRNEDRRKMSFADVMRYNQTTTHTVRPLRSGEVR